MPSSMLTALVGGLLATTSLALPQKGQGAYKYGHGRPQNGNKGGAKNFIFIVPDGQGPPHHTLARDYLSLIQEGSSADSPVIVETAVDDMTVGRLRTHSADSMITDSAAAGTAFATGFKTNNGMISIDPEGNILGTILEAAHLAGYKTGLAVTSVIAHATPAVFSSHVESRNNYDDITAQQIGYSHPLGSVVDVMLGGGACSFKPMNVSGSCRDDNLDLFGWARSNGWTVMEDKASFDALNGGEDVELPYIGLFTEDSHMMYDIDRQQRPDEEPSLQDMAETAITSLRKATEDSEKGYFLMIEASRIDHASHANDPVGTLWDTIEYEDIVKYVKEHIDSHPDTVMMAAADHETGGLVLDGPGDFDPEPLQYASASISRIADLWEEYDGDDSRSYLADTLLPMYGLNDVNATMVDTLMASENILGDMVDMLNDVAGITWGSFGHTTVDCAVIGYAHGEQWDDFKVAMAGGHENTELVDYMAKMMGVQVSDATEAILAAMAEEE